MPKSLTNNEQVERVRQAVLKTNGEVTVGDIVSATGLGTYEAKNALDQLITTHEGVMRVSHKGEILYAFAPGCVLRDQRTWWERNKKTVMKVIKTVFKVIIMLTLVLYFIIYLVILLALIFGNRDGESSGGSLNFNGAIWLFWGYGGGSYDSRWSNQPRKEPLYTRIFNFVFGPEEVELDPLEARSRCAQLIRAKKGVITVEDWMVVSGQERTKCESDLARYTAEFDGTLEITESGTIVYTFEEMMRTKDTSTANHLPALAWEQLEAPLTLSGNVNGGNGMVIGLNLFNLIMAGVFQVGGNAYINQLQDPYYALQHGLKPQDVEALVQSVDKLTFWLGLFPLIFSGLIFAGPLIRLPGHLKENRARRERSVRKAVMHSVFNKNIGAATRFSPRDLEAGTNMILQRQYLKPATQDEIKAAINTLCAELGGEIDLQGYYIFKDLDGRMRDTASERKRLALDQQQFGQVVFSTDMDEQEEIEDAEDQADMDDFDRALREAGKNQREDYGQYGQSNSGSSRSHSNFF